MSLCNSQIDVAERDDLLALIERDLEQRLARPDLPANLMEAIRYAVLGAGKRLRPRLAVLSCEAVGGQALLALPAAAAIELIHCFSLVHDDLPAMDDDKLRRGRPTLHIHAGEAMAILAGDAMVSLAFECINDAQLNAIGKGALTTELAQATTAMIAGQVYDTLGGGGFPSDLADTERLHLTHCSKTGALVRAACRIGAICGNASPAQLDSLTLYGESMGLMFQIVDDVIDVTQSPEHAGKATGKDESAGKLTFPGVLGMERSVQEIALHHGRAQQALAPPRMGASADPLRRLADLMAVRTK